MRPTTSLAFALSALTALATAQPTDPLFYFGSGNAGSKCMNKAEQALNGTRVPRSCPPNGPGTTPTCNPFNTDAQHYINNVKAAVGDHELLFDTVQTGETTFCWPTTNHSLAFNTGPSCVSVTPASGGSPASINMPPSIFKYIVVNDLSDWQVANDFACTVLQGAAAGCAYTVGTPFTCPTHSQFLVIYMIIYPNADYLHDNWVGVFERLLYCKVRKIVFETYVQKPDTPLPVEYYLGNNPKNTPPIPCDNTHIDNLLNDYHQYIEVLASKVKLVNVERSMFSLTMPVKNECASRVQGETPYLNDPATDIACLQRIGKAAKHVFGFQDVSLYNIAVIADEPSGKYTATGLLEAALYGWTHAQ